MGVVEDVRKLLQDLVTPEMRALAVKVDAVNHRLDGLHEEINRRFEGVDKRFDTLRDELNRRFDYIERSFRVDERIAALEEKVNPPTKRKQ